MRSLRLGRMLQTLKVRTRKNETHIGRGRVIVRVHLISEHITAYFHKL